MLLGIGDIHQDALFKYIPDAPKLVLATMQKVYDVARKEGITDIVLLGDIYDNAFPDDGHVLNFLKFLRNNVKIYTHVLMGNHDHDDVKHHSMRSLSWLFETGFVKGKVYRAPEKVDIDGERYFFCPHPYIEDQPKGVRYSFGHFGYEGAKGDNGFAIKSGKAPKGRWILGDYHTAQKGQNFIYPGSICQVGFHENPKKYYLQLDDEPKLIRIEPELKLGRVSINSLEQLKALDPAAYWSVNIGADAKLPADWASKFPHVIRHHTTKAVSKRAQLLMQEVANDDPLSGLEEYLIAEGLSDKEIDRAYALLGV